MSQGTALKRHVTVGTTSDVTTDPDQKHVSQLTTAAWFWFCSSEHISRHLRVPKHSDRVGASDHLASEPTLVGADPQNGMHLLMTLESSIWQPVHGSKTSTTQV